MFSDYKNYEMKITDNNITLTIYNQLQFSTLRTLELIFTTFLVNNKIFEVIFMF